MLAKLKAKGYLVSVINMREHEEFCDLHEVNLASTYIFMDKGKIIHRHIGHLMEIEVRDWLKKKQKKKKLNLI